MNSISRTSSQLKIPLQYSVESSTIDDYNNSKNKNLLLEKMKSLFFRKKKTVKQVEKGEGVKRSHSFSIQNEGRSFPKIERTISSHFGTQHIKIQDIESKLVRDSQFQKQYIQRSQEVCKEFISYLEKIPQEKESILEIIRENDDFNRINEFEHFYFMCLSSDKKIPSFQYTEADVRFFFNILRRNINRIDDVKISEENPEIGELKKLLKEILLKIISIKNRPGIDGKFHMKPEYLHFYFGTMTLFSGLHSTDI